MAPPQNGVLNGEMTVGRVHLNPRPSQLTGTENGTTKEFPYLSVMASEKEIVVPAVTDVASVTAG